MTQLKTRRLRDDFFFDLDLAHMCGDTKTLYLGLLCYADRNGNFPWNEDVVQAVCLPFVHKTNKRFSTKETLEWLKLKGKISQYEVDGKLYGHCLHFHSQRPHPNEPETCPEPPKVNQGLSKGEPKVNQGTTKGEPKDTQGSSLIKNKNKNNTYGNSNSNIKSKLGIDLGDLKSTVTVLDFDEFWKTYKRACQNHVETSSPGERQRAKERWERSMTKDPDLLFVLPVALSNLIIHKTHYEEKFAHAATWLNTEWWIPYFKEWEAPKEKKVADPLEGIEDWEPLA